MKPSLTLRDRYISALTHFVDKSTETYLEVITEDETIYEVRVTALHGTRTWNVAVTCPADVMKSTTTFSLLPDVHSCMRRVFEYITEPIARCVLVERTYFEPEKEEHEDGPTNP